MLGYEALTRAYSPLLVCVDWEKSIFKRGERVKLPVWVINDLHKEFDRCSVKWRLSRTKNRLMEGSRRWSFAEIHLPWLNFPVLSVPRTVCPGEEEAEVLSEGSFELEIPADSVQKAGEVSFSFTEPIDLRLELFLMRDNETLSSNRYHFLVR
jgi:hypothetical protein